MSRARQARMSRRKSPREPEEWTVPVAADVATRVAFEPADAPLDGDVVLVVAHGAGSDMDHRSTVGVAAALRSIGVHTVRFDLPYRAAGRGRPDPMPKLMQGYRDVVASVRERLAPGALLLGGRSLGGRTATMLAADGEPCDGLVLFAYPLHPPGKPERLRDAHLASIEAPVLMLSGTRDAFFTPALAEELMTRLPERFVLHWLEGADHGYHVLKRSGRTPEDVLAEAARVARGWIEERVLA